MQILSGWLRGFLRSSTPLPKGKTDIRKKMDLLTPAHGAGDFAQACMDIGASICTAKNPKCDICPVADHCKAKNVGNPETYPIKPPKKANRFARPASSGSNRMGSCCFPNVRKKACWPVCAACRMTIGRHGRMVMLKRQSTVTGKSIPMPFSTASPIFRLRWIWRFIVRKKSLLTRMTIAGGLWTR